MALLNNALLSTNTSRPLVYASLPLVSASLPLVNSTGLVLAQLVPFNVALLLPPNPPLALLFAARVLLALVCWAVFLLVLSSPWFRILAHIWQPLLWRRVPWPGCPGSVNVRGGCPTYCIPSPYRCRCSG